MPSLTRRRDPDSREETWLISYGDVHVGTIGMRSGNPPASDSWSWRCGFYPGSRPCEGTSGTAESFEAARTAFEAAWSVFLSRRTENDFQQYRRHRAFVTWTLAMLDAGCKLPTQVAGGHARCFCGEAIDIASTAQHVYAAHMKPKAA